MQLERAQHPLGARHAQHDRIGGADEERRRQHRQNHGGEERLQQLV
jgi:hypothetical protein